MLDKIKNIADWWGNTSINKRYAVLNLLVILGLCYLLYYNDRVHRENETDFKLALQHQATRIDGINRRCDSLSVYYRKTMAQQQEEFNKRQIEVYDYFTALFKKVFEETDYRYHERRQSR